MSHTPFTYTPEEYFDCGWLGEHPITFISWIDQEPGSRPRVNIASAIVEIFYGDIKQEVDATAHIMANAFDRARWEEEILSAYENAKEKLERDFDEGA